MAETTSIAWTRSSWNPWIGCTRASPGCDHCYAEALDKRHRWGGAVHWGAGVPRYRTSVSNWNKPRVWNKKAAETGERWTVFPSLCDPFDNEVPDEWRFDLWQLIYNTPSLTWLLLTKRIGNATKMLQEHWNVLPNVWIGASVVNQEEADRDIPKLLAVPAAKRFVSYEPALGPVDFAAWLYSDRAQIKGDSGPVSVTGQPVVDWIIVGGESDQGKNKARPFNVEWAENTIKQCSDAKVACFVKQLGSLLEVPNRKVNGITVVSEFIDTGRDPKADPSEWAGDLRVQEFPPPSNAPAK